MATVSDFIQIVGDSPRNIGNAVVEIPFNTGGRNSAHSGFLLFNLRGLTAGPVNVLVNNQVIGSLQPYPGANASHWFAQMVSLSGATLANGVNELQLESADSFQIKNVFCFFHQDS